METGIALSRALLLLIGTGAVKAAIVLAAAAFTVRLLRDRAASFRHLVWTAALGAAVAFVPLERWLPTWHILPRFENDAVVATPDPLRIPLTVLELPASAASRHSVVPTDAGSPATIPSRPAWPLGLAMLWAVGCLVLAGRYLRQLSRLHHLPLVASSPPDETLCGALATELGIRRRVHLALSSGTPVPLTWGIITPRIVLPLDAARWTAARRRRVLRHELAHIHRFDVLSHGIAMVAETVFWFFPVVRWAGRAARRESELACDDAVLRAGARPSDYADDLLTVGVRAFADAFPALAFASERSTPLLERRVVALLDPTRRRAPLARRSAVAVIAGTLALTCALSMLRSRLAEAEQPPPTRATAPATVTSPAPARHRAVARRTAATQAPAMPVATSGSTDPLASCTAHMNHHDHGGPTSWVASGDSDECLFSLTSSGALGFAANGTDLVSITPGGVLDLTVTERGAVTHVTVRPGDNGVLRYEADGVPANAAATWLSGAMVAIDRVTAFAAAARLPDMLARGGVDAALQEVGAMRSDHARTVYLSLLARQAVLDQAQTVRAVALAMSIGQDSERARVLNTLSRRSR